MKKNNIFTLLLSLLLIVSGIWYLGIILRPTDTDDVRIQIDSFHSLPENSLDVIVYGSSHSYRGFDTRVLNDDYNISAYNYSWNWLKMNTTKAFIKDSLVSQKPKVVLIETYYANENLHDCDINAEIYFSRYLKNKTAVMDFINECFGDNFRKKLSFYVPLYAFHDNWIDISLKSLLPAKTNNSAVTNRGFCDIQMIDEISIVDQNSCEQKTFDDYAIKNLDEIVSICNENDIDIIFYTAPFEWAYEYADAMEEYAKNNNCLYINSFKYLDEIGIDEKTDFSDPAHLNTYGAQKLARFIGKYISENYIFN